MGKPIDMNEEKINPEDYIALPSLRRLIVEILQFFFSVLNQFSAVFTNRKFLLSLGLVLGLMLGYFYYYNRASRYEVSMIAESSNLHVGTIAEMVKNLNNLISTQSYHSLSRFLDLSEKEVRQITSMVAFGMDNELLETDTTTQLHQPFKIVAGISNTDLTDRLQIALVNYFNHKLNVKRMNDDQVRIYKEKLVFIEKELSKLDSLKSEYTHFLASSKVSATFYNNAFDPADIYKQSSALMKDKEEALSWLSTSSEPIIVIDEFKPMAKPRSASLFRALFIGATIGLSTSFLFGLLIELNEKTKKISLRH